MSYSTTEIEDAFVAGLRADATLTALLADATAVHRGYSPDAKPFPLIVVEFATVPDPTTGGRRFDADWTLSLFGPSGRALRDIAGVLNARWLIPDNRPEGLTSANFRVDTLRWRNAVPAGPLRWTDQAEPIHALHTEWRGRLSYTGGG